LLLQRFDARLSRNRIRLLRIHVSCVPLEASLSASFPLICRSCGGLVSVVFEDHPSGGLPEEASWTCPHCGVLHRTGIVGRILDVRIRMPGD
jgi:hypothetical protein